MTNLQVVTLPLMASPEISWVSFSDFYASVRRKWWEIRWHLCLVFMRQNNWSLLYVPSFFEQHNILTLRRNFMWQKYKQIHKSVILKYLFCCEFGLFFLRASICHLQDTYETWLNCLCGQLKFIELAIKGLYPNYVKWTLTLVIWSSLPACLLELVIPARCCSSMLGVSLPLTKGTQSVAIRSASPVRSLPGRAVQRLCRSWDWISKGEAAHSIYCKMLLFSPKGFF